LAKHPVAPASVRLKHVKAAHTAIWAFFAACILAIPIASWLTHYRAAFWLAAIVGVEIIVLLLNGWKCPLTAIAARHTIHREANFDIYLPEWLASHNKSIFGVLYVAGVVFTVVRWGWTRG
jgi:hypothetical protein